MTRIHIELIETVRYSMEFDTSDLRDMLARDIGLTEGEAREAYSDEQIAAEISDGTIEDTVLSRIAEKMERYGDIQSSTLSASVVLP